MEEVEGRNVMGTRGSWVEGLDRNSRGRNLMLVWLSCGLALMIALAAGGRLAQGRMRQAFIEAYILVKVSGSNGGREGGVGTYVDRGNTAVRNTEHAYSMSIQVVASRLESHHLSYRCTQVRG